jgi:hypothetical protein
MSRTAITLTTLASVKDATITPTTLAGTAVDPTNGMNVAHAFDQGGSKVFLYIHHTTVSTKVLTVRKGAYPPALRKHLGDLTYTLAAGTDYLLGPFEAAQFSQSDGSLNLDIAAAATGNIQAFKLPRDV